MTPVDLASLPRLLGRPLAERVQFAVAWYASRIRMDQLATCAVLSPSQVNAAVVASGFPLRRGMRGGIPLPPREMPDLLTQARAVPELPLPTLAQRLQLSRRSAAGLRALLGDEEASPLIRRRPPKAEGASALLAKRCPQCGKVEPTTRDHSPCCEVPYGAPRKGFP